MFGVSITFLVVGHAELSRENSLDPVVAAVEQPDTSYLEATGHLWNGTLVVNPVGGLMVFVPSVEVLPTGTESVSSATAVDIVSRRAVVEFADATAGGVVVASLSCLLPAADRVGSRIVLECLVGNLLALGPFDQLRITVFHVFLGGFPGRDQCQGAGRDGCRRHGWQPC